MGLRFLLGIEETAGIRQKKAQGQKNEENNKDNRFVERRSFEKCTMSSAGRRSRDS